MKASSLLLLFAIISLSEAARPNLRFLRKIAGRPIRQINNPTKDPAYIAVPELFKTVTLQPVYIFFNSYEELLEELKDILQNINANSLEAAYQYCAQHSNFKYEYCQDYIDNLIKYWKKAN